MSRADREVTAISGETALMATERLTPEIRQARTRAALLAAADEVFATRGFHGATLDEIADAAGFSKGAIYSNFTSKEDLFLALLNEKSESIIAEYAAVAADGSEAHATPQDRLRAMANVYLERDEDLSRGWAMLAEFDLYALRRRETLPKLARDLQRATALVAEMVQRQCEDLGVELSIPIEDLAMLNIAIYQGLWRQKAIDPESVPDDLAPRAVMMLFEAAITTSTSREHD